MPNTRTLAQLRASVQTRGSYEGSRDLTPTILTELVNEAIAETYDLIVGKWADYYTLTGAPFVTVSGTGSYVLDTIAPSFYKFRKLEVLVSGIAGQSSERWKRLYPHDLDAGHLYSAWSLAAKDYRYRLQGANLVLVPTPQTVETMRVFFIPFATRLVADADTFDGINGYEELVIQIALRRCLVRQDLDTAGVDGEIARLMARVRQAADGRDAAEPFYLNASGPGSASDDDDWWW